MVLEDCLRRDRRPHHDTCSVVQAMEVDASTALWLDAIVSRSYDNAHQLLREGQDVNVRGAGGTTALHVLASRYDTQKKIQQLLLAGADPHLTDDHARTPLRIAQRHNCTEVVYFFIYYDELLRALADRLGRKPELVDISAMMRHKRMRQFRGDIQRRLEEKTRKLITAARAGDLETVKSMVESREAPIDTVDRITGETAFSAALAAGCQRVCEYLLAKDAHLYAPCILHDTSLSVLSAAVATGDVDFVRRLLSRGAMLTMPPEAEIDRGSCPLAEAVTSGSIEMVDTLLKLGARAASRSHGLSLPWPANLAFDFTSSHLDDETPWRLLAIACWQNDSTMIEYLFETQDALSDRSMMAKHGAHALFLAVLQENESLVIDLLARGVSVNEVVGENATALVAAVAANSVKMLHFLLDRGADASVVHGSLRTNTGYTEGLLTTAVYAGAMDCAHELLPLETRPQHLDQALQVTAERGDADFARLLLDVARPSTSQALFTSVYNTSCPLMLDLLLSRCSDERFAFESLNSCFPEACKRKSSELVSVFLAYGIDINFDDPNETFPPLAGALLVNKASGVEIATILIENGMEIVSDRRPDGHSLLGILDEYMRCHSRSAKRQFYEAGRDQLVAHDVFQTM